MIKALGERIIGASEEEADGEDAPNAEKKSLLGSFDLKSLLAKKTKPVPATAE